jgi:hydrogenase nickel incorporation protein HypA/HybF
MHELAITQNVLDMVLDKAREAGASRVTGINMVIGGMSDVVDECVQFYLDVLSQETIASGAKLIFKKIPIQVRCRRCRQEFSPVPGALWNCPGCGECDAEVTAGKEFFIESIEVE